MSKSANADWNGSTGIRWVETQANMDWAMRGLGEAAMDAARVAPGERVLDIGCGCGDTTFALGAKVGPTGKVLGVDVSSPMLERARARLAAGEGGGWIELVQADAANVAFVEKLDVLYSRFGLTFFEDPATAFANLFGALARGGRLAFVCWRAAAENEWVMKTLPALAAHLAPPPTATPGAPGPFAFASETRIREVLEGAGFEDIVLRKLDPAIQWTRSASLDEAVDHFARVGPGAAQLEKAAPPAQAKARDALRRIFADHMTPDGLVLGGAAWIVTART